VESSGIEVLSKKWKEDRKLDCRSSDARSDGQNMIANPLAENHHPGGTGPPEARELRLVQIALSSLNTPKTMQLKGSPAGRASLAGGLLHSFSEPAGAAAFFVLTVNQACREEEHSVTNQL